MDMIAINDLRARYQQAVRAAKTYRDAAEDIPPLREFYRALAFTYERMAQEARLMIDKAEGLSQPAERAA